MDEASQQDSFAFHTSHCNDFLFLTFHFLNRSTVRFGVAFFFGVAAN